MVDGSAETSVLVQIDEKVKIWDAVTGMDKGKLDVWMEIVDQFLQSEKFFQGTSKDEKKIINKTFEMANIIRKIQNALVKRSKENVCIRRSHAAAHSSTRYLMVNLVEKAK